MSALKIQDSNGHIIMPESIPLVDMTDVLYSQNSGGTKTYTATKRCIAFTKASGQASISITSNGVTSYLPSTQQSITVQLEVGDTITVPGYSTWVVGLNVYGVKYPS